MFSCSLRVSRSSVLTRLVDRVSTTLQRQRPIDRSVAVTEDSAAADGYNRSNRPAAATTSRANDVASAEYPKPATTTPGTAGANATVPATESTTAAANGGGGSSESRGH